MLSISSGPARYGLLIGVYCVGTIAGRSSLAAWCRIVRSPSMNKIGEDFIIKLPKYLANCFKEGEPLDEQTGEHLARWAKGTDAAARGERHTLSLAPHRRGLAAWRARWRRRRCQAQLQASDAFVPLAGGGTSQQSARPLRRLRRCICDGASRKTWRSAARRFVHMLSMRTSSRGPDDDMQLALRTAACAAR